MCNVRFIENCVLGITPPISFSYGAVGRVSLSTYFMLLPENVVPFLATLA